MIDDIRRIALDSPSRLVGDVLGCAALVVLACGGLFLPALL